MSEQKNSKKNFWPLGIALFMSFMVVMIILTIYISIKYKPDDDKAYFSTRQEVDKNINDILQTQQELEKQFSFYVLHNSGERALERRATKKTSPLVFGNDLSLAFKVLDSKGVAIEPSLVRVYMTRFADAREDTEIENLQFANGVFQTPTFTLRNGDWKAVIEFDINGKKAYFEQYIVVE